MKTIVITPLSVVEYKWFLQLKRCEVVMSKFIFRLVICLGIIAIVVACLFRFGPLNSTGKSHTDVSSILIDAIDIDELSTAEFSYKGIATVYKNDNRTDIKCRVCYSAVVKAGINMHDVRFDVDEDNKTITAILPEIELRVYINDEEPMALLPSDVNVEIDILRTCS